MNGFAALDLPPCRRYVVKATAGLAVCRHILKLLLFYSCLDFPQYLGKALDPELSSAISYYPLRGQNCRSDEEANQFPETA